MTLQLRALSFLSEDLDLISSTPMTAENYMQIQF